MSVEQPPRSDGQPPPPNAPPQHPVPHERVEPDEGSDSSSVGDDMDVVSITSSIEDQLTWRGRMQVALHSLPFHIAIIVLVVMDALIVLFELLLDVGALDNVRCYGEAIVEQAHYCHYIFNRTECGPSADLVLQNLNLTPWTGHFCACRFSVGKFVCLSSEAPPGVNPAFVLHIASLTILSTFLVEIFLKLVAFRLKYFTHKFEVFDGFVVVISWILDMASILREETFEIGQLIIVLRLWRVIRIVNGAVLSAKAQSDKKLHDARSEARRVIHALHKSQEKNKRYTEYTDKLTNILEKNSIPVPEMEKPFSSIPTYPWDKEEGINM